MNYDTDGAQIHDSGCFHHPSAWVRCDCDVARGESINPATSQHPRVCRTRDWKYSFCNCGLHHRGCPKSDHFEVICNCAYKNGEQCRVSNYEMHYNGCNTVTAAKAVTTTSCLCGVDPASAQPWEAETVVDDHSTPALTEQDEDDLIAAASRPSAIELIRRAKARGLLKPVKGYGPLI